MQVAEILRKKGGQVATVAPSDTVGHACDELRRHGVGALVVSTDGSSIDGIVSERDVVRALGGDAPLDLLDKPCADIMTAEVFTCSPLDRVESLMSMMTENRIRHLPVLVDAGLGGIVSIGDVVKFRLSELEAEARIVEDYIHHGR